jgi:hypothetical protein
MRGRVALVVLVFLSSFPVPAVAEDSKARAAARELGGQGVTAYKREAYPEALDKLQRAYEVVRVPSLGLWSARALNKLGRWVEASERYVEVTRLDASSGNPAIQEKAKKDAQAELAELRARIPALELTVAGVARQDVTILLDGGTLPPALLGTRVPIDPGPHRLEVRYAEQLQEKSFVATERQVVPISMQFREVVPKQAERESALPVAGTGSPASSQPGVDSGGGTQRAVGWVAVGVGSAGVVVGAVAGLLAMNQRGELEGACQNGSCWPDKADQVDSYNTKRSLSSAAFIAGGVIGLTGVVLVLSAPREPHSVSLRIGPRAVVLQGAL